MTRFPHDPHGVKDVRDFLATLPPIEGMQPLQALARDAKAMSPQELQSGYEKAMNDNYRVSGWKLQDVPFVCDGFWNELIDVLDSDNMKVITLTSRGKGEDLTRRGTILISPTGINRLKEYVQKKKESSG